MGQRNRVLDGARDFLMGSGNFEGERAAHCKVYEHFAVICAKMAEPIEMPFGFGTWVVYVCMRNCIYYAFEMSWLLVQI